MDPLSRKLFKSRDARNKLRAQGGIMASSPEMVQEVAKFAKGSLVEVPGYLDSGRAEVSSANPARNLDLIAALNQSSKGAEFADWLNSVGQSGVDAASRAFNQVVGKVGGAGLQLDAELGMAMSMAAGFLGFPEKAAKWRDAARDEMRYGTQMVEGKIGPLGSPTEGYSVPDSARRMYEAARVKRMVEQAGPDSALLSEGLFSEQLKDIPGSIIQSRITPPPEVPTSAPELTGPISALGGDRPPVIPTPEGVVTSPGRAPTLPYMDVLPSSPARLPQGDAYMMPEKYRSFYDDLTKSASGLEDQGITAEGLASRFIGVNPSYTEEGSAAAADARMAEREALRNEQEARARAVDFMRYSPQAQPEAPVGALESMASAAATRLGKFNRGQRPRGQDMATEDLSGLTGEQLLPPAAEVERVAPVVETEQDVATGRSDRDQQGTGTGAAAAAAAAAGTGTGTGTGSLETTYEQMLSRLEGVMGKEADEDKRKKAMANLAMIGLAIASGQSPDALTNIAQGALTGMQGVQAAEAAKKASERELRLEAMKMAASEVELNKRLQNALDVANVRGSTGGGTYTDERLFQQNMDAILRNPDMFDVFSGEVVDPMKVRNLAAELAGRGMSVGGTTGGGPSIGDVVDGYKFIGGNASDPGSWEKVE